MTYENTDNTYNNIDETVEELQTSNFVETKDKETKLISVREIRSAYAKHNSVLNFGDKDLLMLERDILLFNDLINISDNDATNRILKMVEMTITNLHKIFLTHYKSFKKTQDKAVSVSHISDFIKYCNDLLENDKKQFRDTKGAKQEFVIDNICKTLNERDLSMSEVLAIHKILSNKNASEILLQDQNNTLQTKKGAV